jgi:hypothetical protein
MRRDAMDKRSEELSVGLENEIRTLQEAIEYFQDPRIIGMEDISGTGTNSQEIVAHLLTRVKEIRELIDLVRSQTSPPSTHP